MNATIKILFVEHDSIDLELIENELKKDGFNYVSEVVQNEKDFSHALKNFAPDIILSDYTFPSFDGPTAFKMKEEIVPETPFIFVSGTIGEENSIELIKNGVTDYALKDRIFSLPVKVKRALKESADRQQKNRAEQALLQSEARLAESQTVSKVGSWETELSTWKVIWSKETYRIFEIDPRTFHPSHRGFLAFVHPDDRAKVDAAFVSSFDQHKLTAIEHRIVTPGGVVKEVEERWNIFYDEQGLALRAVGTCQDITERKKAETLLIASENHLRTIVLAEPECVKLLGINSELEDMNPAGLAMIEADNLAQVKGKSMLGIINKPYRQAFKELTQNVFTGTSGEMEFEITGLKGAQRWLQTHSVPLKNAEGKIVSLLGVTRDITDRKKAEERLAASEVRYRTLFEAATDGILILDADTGMIEDVNPFLTSLFHYSLEELQGKRFWEIDLFKAIANNESAFLKLTKDRYARHNYFSLQTNLGQTVWVAFASHVYEANGKQIMQCHIHNITERKKSEDKIRESELRYRLLIEQATDAIYITSASMRYEDINPAGCALLGYSKEEFLQLSPTDLVFEEDTKIYALKLEEVESGRAISYQRKMKRKDGTAVEVEANGKMLNDGRFVIFARDITERKKAEQKLRKSEAFNSGVLNALSSHIAVIDKSGKIVAVNESWKRFARENGETTVQRTGVGSNYFDVCYRAAKAGDETAAQALEGIKEVIEQKVSFFYLEYPCHAPDKPRWFGMRALKFDNDEPMAVLAHMDISERKLAEDRLIITANALQHALGDLNKIMDSSLDVICTVNQEGRFLKVSAACEAVWGYTADELIGKPLINFVYPKDHEKTIKAAAKVMSGINITNFENRYVRKDGSVVPISWSVRWDAKDKVRYGVARDVTERKKAEKKLAYERALLRTLIDNIPDYIYVKDTQSRHLINNKANVELLGAFTEEKTIGKTVSDFIETDMASDYLKDDQLVFNSGKPLINHEETFISKTGEQKYLLTTKVPLRDYKNSIIGLIGISRDITWQKQIELNLLEKKYLLENEIEARKKAEEEITLLNQSLEKKVDERTSQLKESEAQIQTIFKYAPDAVVVIDEEGRIVKWNPMAEVIFGWQIAEVIGKHLHEIIIPPQFREAHVKGMSHFLKTGEGRALNRQLELPALRKDNTAFDAGISISPTLVNGKHVFIGFINDITERKKAEGALNKLNAELEQRVIDRTAEVIKSEKRFKALIENNHDIIALLNEKFELVYRSPSAEHYTGWTEEERKHLNNIEQTHPDDVELRNRVMQQVLQHPAKPFSIAFRIRHKNGHYVWMEGTAMNMLHDPSVGGIITNFRDVTERKKTEEKLAHERALLRTLIDNIPDYIYVKDTQSRHLINNKANVALLGASSENTTIGKTVSDFIAPEISTSFLNNDQLVFQTGEPIINQEETIISNTGEQKYLLTTKVPLRDAKNSVIGLVGISRDITWQKRAAENILQSEARLKEAQAISHISNWEVDLLTNINTWSDEFYRIMGIVRGEIQPSPEAFLSLLHPDDFNRIKEIVEKTFQTLESSFFYARTKVINNSSKHIYSQWQFEFDRSQKPIRLYGILQDITDRKKAEEEILALNQNLEKKVEERTSQWQAAHKELEAFSYSVSHDLRTPLRSIDGYARILVEDYAGKLDEEGKKVIATISRNAQRMGQLIDDMLAFSKFGRIDMSLATINMNEVVESALRELMLNEQGRDIKTEVANLHTSQGDVNMLRLVWQNYISNALKFTGRVKKTHINIGSYATAHEVCYSIKDNGAGFDNQYAPKLFGVFQRLHKQNEFEGTGVGLATCKRIIERHGGRVWAEAESGKGATFYFSLPKQ